MKGFKYQKEHSLLDCVCPPIDSLFPIKMTAYRWVKEDLDDIDNYIPPLKIKPNRIEEIETCKSKCDNYALSFFVDKNIAEKKLRRFLIRKPCLIDVFGNAIAKSSIVEDDGLDEQPSEGGHFNFHEYENNDFRGRFDIVKVI